jgi:hypothetical protein
VGQYVADLLYDPAVPRLAESCPALVNGLSRGFATPIPAHRSQPCGKVRVAMLKTRPMSGPGGATPLYTAPDRIPHHGCVLFSAAVVAPVALCGQYRH